MQIGAATVENSMEFPQKLKMELPLDPVSPLLRIYSNKLQTLIWKNIYIPMFIAALFTIAVIWKQPKCPSEDEWIKKLWYVYTVEYSAAVKKKEIILFATACIHLQGFMLSEISQSENDKYHIILLIHGV